MSVLLLLLLVAGPRPAAPGHELFGAVGAHVIAPGESLIELARRYDVGFNEMAASNPALDPFVPTPGAAAVVPTAWILPRATRPGTIVVNLSEMRLYLLPAKGGPPVTFPVGVAVEAGATPLGSFHVVEKAVAPAWRPPASIRAEDPTLPAVVPPGPDNPLGTHALRLSRRTLLIHGTNLPFGVGRRVSHGCIRLYPDDIPRLYALVGVGTPVTIVREPVKVAVRGRRILVEVHEDPEDPADAALEATRLLAARGVLRDVDGPRLIEAVRARRGIPIAVDAGAE